MHDFISNHQMAWSIIALIFVTLPNWAQHFWGLFSKEPLVPCIKRKLASMQIPQFSLYWISTVIGLGLLTYIAFKPCPPPQIIQPKNTSNIFPSPNLDNERLFVSNRYNRDDDVALCAHGMKFFNEGNYPYAALFLSQCDSNQPNNPRASWIGNRPMLAAALYAENPTSAGYHQFTNSLNQFVAQARQQVKDKYGWLAEPGKLNNSKNKIGSLIEMFPEDSQKQFIRSVYSDLEEILDQNPSLNYK